jgi:hypothetical protein
MKNGYSLTLTAVLFLSLLSISEASDSADSNTTGPMVQVTSDPPGLGITLNGEISESSTPKDFSLTPGSHEITVFGEGWEPLAHTIGLDSLTTLRLRFLMRVAPPVMPTPESVGLAREPEQPLQDERAAERIRSRFTKAAETFLIFPFAQGVIMKFTLEEEEQQTADAFLISGALLSTGSYLLGRLLSSRKLNRIREENDQTMLSNHEASVFNREVDRILDSIYRTQYEIWEAENSDRGVVEESPE